MCSKYQGESEKYMSKVFSEAKKCTRAVVFFDEFDAIATARGGKMEDCSMHRRLLAELLLQLSQCQFNATTKYGTADIVSGTLTNEVQEQNGIATFKVQEKICRDKETDTTSKSEDTTGNVMVIAATNRMSDLDEAVIRRFDAKVRISELCDAYARRNNYV